MEPHRIDFDAVWCGDMSSVEAHAAEGLEVRSIEGKGRGVCTTRAFRAGELLLAERAVACASEPELVRELASRAGGLDGLTRRRLALLCDDASPATLAQPVPLREWPGQSGGGDGGGALGKGISLARVQQIVKYNAYRCASPVSEYMFMADDGAQLTESERHSVYGLFLLGSLVNHSCVPNVSKVLLGDWVFLRAARDLSPGTELTQIYCDVRMPRKTRLKELHDLFGFGCSCPRCVFEGSMEDSSGHSSASYTRVYGSQVPALDPRSGPVQISQLEGLVAEAEHAVQAMLAAHRLRGGATSNGNSCTPTDQHDVEQWLLWPLVPVLSQLARRLRLDGRLPESALLWRRAERATRDVLPLSNLHVHVTGELLLTEAQQGHRPGLEEALALSRESTALAYGGRARAWHALVGARMPSCVLALRKELDEVQPCEIHCSWGATEMGESGLRRATLRAESSAFRRREDISLDASSDVILIAAPGVEAVHVPCPFTIDVERVKPRFSRQAHILTVSVAEQSA